MRNMVELAEKLELVISCAKLGRDYGLFTQKIAFPRSGGNAKEYRIFSLTPIKGNLNPVELIKRRKRHPNIFYPGIFAIEWNTGNPLLMWEKIANYLGYAEFVNEIYEEFGAPLPEAIRTDELEALSNFYCRYNDENFDAETRRDYLDGLKQFFDNERAVEKSEFKKAWHEFYRSGFFDGDRSLFSNFLNYMKRDRLEADLMDSFESDRDDKKVYMSEHHYKEFQKIMKARFPEVQYSVSKKLVSDKGILVDPETGKRAKTAYGVEVTDEEYDKIIEERFAKEGFRCIDGLTPTIFAGRDIFYKAVDERYLASVSHEITLRWVKCWDLSELKQSGRVNFVDVPASYMMNLYAGLMENRVPFAIDCRVKSSPNFEVLRVVYNTCHEYTVQNILIGLTINQVNMAHILLDNENVMFDINVQNIEKMVQKAKGRKHLD